MKYFLLIVVITLFSPSSHAHEHQATATYLGNEGIMIQEGDIRIVFDPFFHNGYNNYQLVPENIRMALFSGTEPYNNINAMFISHAHGDHFAADDVLKFLQSHSDTKLIAPSQAVEKLAELKPSDAVMKQVISIDLKLGDKVKTIKVDDLFIEVVRIPHAGWPGRADISNLIFRVTLNNAVTIMHMGDADPNDMHFKPYQKHWQKQKTNTAFPPYWFFTSSDGPIILDERINTETSVGIHVPIKVPFSLEMTGEAYFSKPSEQKTIGHKHAN